MSPYFIAMFLTVLRASADNATEPQQICDGVVFGGTYYEKVRLFENIWKPTNLLMVTYNGNLLFSHTLSNVSAFDFTITSCHVVRRICVDILEVPSGRAIAYDRQTRLIYFGGNDGIYRYNVRNNKVKFFAEKGKSIWAIAIRRNMYYIEYPSQQLYSFIDGRFSLVSRVEVNVFFISSKFTIYFGNTTGLYMVDVETRLPKILSNKIIVRQIAEDDNDYIFFGAKDGIYMYDIRINKLRKIADIDNVYGIAFAKINPELSNQFIYSDEHAINILVPSDRELDCTK